MMRILCSCSAGLCLLELCMIHSFIYLVLPEKGNISKQYIYYIFLFLTGNVSFSNQPEAARCRFTLLITRCIKLGSFKLFTSLRVAEPKLAGVRGWKS